MFQQINYRSAIKKNAFVILPIIGVALIIVMLGIVWFWETSGRQLYFYEEVIVFNRDIQRGTIINEDMLTFMKIEADKIISQAILTKEEIIDFEVKHFIPKGMQLHPQFFETQDLTTKDDMYIVRIPNEWLYSIPNTLRRKDNVLFYQVNLENESNIKSNNNGLIDTYEDINEIDNIRQITRVNPILETKVAYVKDSANREVRTVSYEDRIDGSSVISEVLIIASPEQLRILENAVNKAGKLIIMYSEGE